MYLKKIVTIALSLMVVTLNFAQTKKLDKIIKKDYEVIDCTITKETDATVEYKLPNETMTVSLDNSKIARIQLASGRTQTFEDPEHIPVAQSTSSNSVSGTFKQNTIAVLPVPYINSENLTNSEEMAKFAQNDIYNKLINKLSNISPLVVQDLRDTNSLLRKAGLDYKNIDEVSIDELQKILGVDNIVAAKVSYTIDQSETTGTYGGGNIKINNDYKKAKTNNYSISNTQTDMIYNYKVYFDMYKNGSKIYSQTRQPILYFKDSWMDSVSYLLKRSPIYVKK